MILLFVLPEVCDRVNVLLSNPGIHLAHPLDSKLRISQPKISATTWIIKNTEAAFVKQTV